MTKTLRIPNTDARIRANFSQASSQIEVDWAGHDEWTSTPFQVADARHSPARAIKLVREWGG